MSDPLYLPTVCFFSLVPPDSELICGQSQIQIGLNLFILQSSDLNGTSGHLADPQCSSFTENNGTVWYQVKRQADTCGNILTVRICLITCVLHDFFVVGCEAYFSHKK